MHTRLAAFSIVLIVSLWATGCASAPRAKLTERTGGNAALFGQFQAYDGRTGRRITLAKVTRRCARADVVLFGEEHSDAVCNQLEAQVFQSLVTRRRPLALAMEFFEADTQAALDAYLTGRIDEAAYREQTRQGRAYVLSHRPLLELCRVAHIPVIAANAPRRLVRTYRTSDLDYETFRAGLDPADRRWLPPENEYLSGPYEERFLAMMREHGPGVSSPAAPASQPASAPASAPATATSSAPTTVATTAPASQPTSSPQSSPASQPAAETPPGSSPERMFQAQLLWDEGMADALADYRARYPAYQMMLIVGGFHVAHDGGTRLKFRQRRPADRVVTIVYRSTTDGRFPFDVDDRNAGDIVIYGIAPPPEESERPPPRPSRPATLPAATTEPAESQPTSSGPAGT